MTICSPKSGGPNTLASFDYLRIYVRRLREKLEANPQVPVQILTERGLGYRFNPHPEDNAA